jgi:hypothetical protein
MDDFELLREIRAFGPNTGGNVPVIASLNPYLLGAYSTIFCRCDGSGAFKMIQSSAQVISWTPPRGLHGARTSGKLFG